MKTPGLGIESPIVLQLDRDKFIGMIVRHGQWVRWLIADSCPCVKNDGRTDPNCVYCNGDGVKYGVQQVKLVDMEKVKVLSNGVLELPCDPDHAIEVRKIVGIREYTVDQIIDGKYVTVLGTPPALSEVVFASFTETLVYSYSGPVYLLGGNILTAPIYMETTDYGSVPGAIIAARNVKNVTQDVIYSDVSTNLDTIIINDDISSAPILPGDELVADVDYIKPHRFVLLGQSERLIDQQWLSSVGGDSAMTFPTDCIVSERDAVVALVAIHVGKTIISRKPVGNLVDPLTVLDQIPEWYVSEISYIELFGNIRVPSTDYVLHGRNQIRWLSNPPDPGTKYYVNYKYNPSYKILKDFPNVRSSENQLFPRKVAVTLMNLGGNKKEQIN